MARHPRFVIPGHAQHVIQRGNNRGHIFVDRDDYAYYLAKLEEACHKFDCSVHAYVLMSNHVHLLITPESEHGISQVMQSLGRNYVRYFNHRYHRTGTLWEGRYKATLIDSERYLLTCYRYIELNPVRAGMVRHPAEYLWSSYHVNALGMRSSLVKPHKLYLALGINGEFDYKATFELNIDDSELDQIRNATNKAWLLGEGPFQRQIEKLSNRQAKPRQRGRKPKLSGSQMGSDSI